jgi:hypothetical protein
MPEVAFTLPVVSGKEELDRNTLKEMGGSRRDEYEAAMREAGITRHAIWHQETPNGTMAVVCVETDDPGAALAQFGSSDAPFNSWFRDQMKEVHGVDISEPAPQIQQVHDVRV